MQQVQELGQTTVQQVRGLGQQDDGYNYQNGGGEQGDGYEYQNGGGEQDDGDEKMVI